MKLRKKTIWIIVLTALIFLSTVTLGIDTVFRVDSVTLNASVISEIAKEEVVSLKERLTAVYDQKSAFKAEKIDAEKILKDFPHFRLIGFEKAYPNRIVVSVTEDAEEYAVATGDGQYYILGADGLILGIRETYVNRLDNAENVLLQGVTISGTKGTYPNGDERFAAMLAFCGEASETLNGIRRNVLCVELIQNTSLLEDAFFLVTMREGVQIYIGTPTQSAAEKAQAAMTKYLSLSDTERLTGRIVVSEKNGEIFSTYAAK